MSQQEAEELLAALESLQGRLATETQPLTLEYDPVCRLGWSQDTASADFKTELEEPANSSSSSIENDERSKDRSFRSP